MPRAGIEPTILDSKSNVLPLHQQSGSILIIFFNSVSCLPNGFKDMYYFNLFSNLKIFYTAASSLTTTLLWLRPKPSPPFDRHRLTLTSLNDNVRYLEEAMIQVVTGGVCRVYSLIHRAVVIRDYWRLQLHNPELQGLIRTKGNFKICSELNRCFLLYLPL